MIQIISFIIGLLICHAIIRIIKNTVRKNYICHCGKLFRTAQGLMNHKYKIHKDNE